LSTSANKYGIFGDCLRGDVRRAIRVARARLRTLTKVEKGQLTRLTARFADDVDKVPIRLTDALAIDVVSEYRRYYRSVLMGRITNKKAETDLFRSVCQILSRNGTASKRLTSFEALEVTLKKVLLKRDLYSLVGEIAPYRSLAIWLRQDSQDHQIVLPETSVRVRVNYVDGVVENGWMGYATLGKFYAGGWVPDDARSQIFCVLKAYRTRPEALRVSLLGHEAQHVVDLRKFPKLSSTDLEYRAKLTELALSRRPSNLLRAFRSQAANERSLPHAFAAWKVSKQFNLETGSSIGKLATTLLSEHTSKLIAVGARAVTTVL
jgi:hypothetical protein